MISNHEFDYRQWCVLFICCAACLSHPVGLKDGTSLDGHDSAESGHTVDTGTDIDSPTDTGTEPDTDTDSGSDTDEPDSSTDHDEDGFSPADGDCDDNDEDVFPGAEEICNDEDDDCDDEIDEGVGSPWWADHDFDGFGDPGIRVIACDQPSGYVANGDDCDDSTASVYPGATDRCNGLDDDCDGAIDEDVKAGWMLVTIDTEAGYVYQIDPDTAALTILSELDDSSVRINTMDVHAEYGTPIVHNSSGRELMTIDVCDGTTESIGATGITSMGGIGFAGGGVLYGLDATSHNLEALDTTTGTANPIRPLGFDLGNSGLAYDCSTDTLWGADSSSGMIFEVDILTGAAVGFVPTSVPFESVGLEFDHSSGLLYASTRYQLFTIDPTTGASTFIGDLSATNIDDLAFHPTCL